MKKISAIVVFTIGVFMYTNAQTTAKPIQKEAVPTIQKNDLKGNDIQKVEKSDLSAPSKDLKSSDDLILQKRTINNPESISKDKVEQIKKEEAIIIEK